MESSMGKFSRQKFDFIRNSKQNVHNISSNDVMSNKSAKKATPSHNDLSGEYYPDQEPEDEIKIRDGQDH